jgi:hypothetical protein
MRIALIDIATQKNIFHNAVVPYPISLLKIGAWRRSLGDEVELFLSRIPPDEFDEFWITTVFTYDMPTVAKIIYNLRPRKRRILVGGIAATLFPDYFERLGIEVHKGLIPEAEKIRPDYSILPERPDYSITHTSRGCVRKCGFCMVSKLEPEFIDRPAWPQDVLDETERILFYDREKKSFSYYALYNFKDSPAEFYYRIKQATLLREKRGIEVSVFPMRYEPINELSSQKGYIGPKWNHRALFGFQKLLNEHSTHGQISPKGCSVFSPLEEFEFWFGKNEEEFIRLINYPGIRKIADSRKQRLRMARLRKRATLETQAAEAAP